MSGLANTLFAQSASRGAEPTVLAASDPNAPKNGYAGPWFMDIWGAAKWGCYVNPAAKDEAVQDKLWKKCEELTQVDFESKL